MTILPFVRPETTFDPDAVAIMSSAFDAALASLNDQTSPDYSRDHCETHHRRRDEGRARSRTSPTRGDQCDQSHR